MEKNKNKKILVIVAHPDDETIWMGGTLLSNRNNWEITIISLCRKDDKDREPKFKKACKILNAKAFISDLEDENLEDIEINEIIIKIKQFTMGKNYDYIFTHGENGEYGHKRHIEVNKAVKEMIKRKLLICKKVFFFSYIKKEESCCPNKKADKFIYLNDLIFSKKKNLIQEVYSFEKNSFEEKSCNKIEAFDIKKI